MNTTFNAKVTGAAEIDRKLENLKGKAARKVARDALKKAAAPIAGQAKTNVRSVSGVTAKSVKIKPGKTRKGMVSVRVTLDKKAFAGAKNADGSAKGFYGDFEEFGHFTGKRLERGEATASVRARANAGANFGVAVRAMYKRLSRQKGRRHVRGTHFMERAFDAQKDAAVEQFAQSVGEQLAAEAS